MSQWTISISKKRNKSKEDVDALHTLKTLRNKGTLFTDKVKIIETLTTSPRKMEKIINTWATIRANRPTRWTVEDNRTFHRLKMRFIKSHFTVLDK